LILADLMDFHRREALPVWWRLFEREKLSEEELRDDPACIAGITSHGSPRTEARSLVQEFRFDPSQECKGKRGDTVMFQGYLDAKFTLHSLDLRNGTLELKISSKKITDCFGGTFPTKGSLVPYEIVSSKPLQDAIRDIARSYLHDSFLPESLRALLGRIPPSPQMQVDGEVPLDTALRISPAMNGGSLVIQGPPGTGKTFTASKVIARLLADGKRVGITSNSHKAIVNLLRGVLRESGGAVIGVRAGGDPDEVPEIPTTDNTKAISSYRGGIIAGTAWLFARSEWIGQLDYLFIDEAGQVSLANATAMSRCAANLVLMGDQMQLEQPIQGTHPGDAGLSVLQYALKDTARSLPDAPVCHQVVPPDAGIFLGETRRMHSSVCSFISTSIYEGRLTAHPDCDRQRISLTPNAILVTQEHGILFPLSCMKETPSAARKRLIESRSWSRSS